MRKTLVITGDAARQAIKRYADEAPEGWIVTFGEPTRTKEQNALLWPLLTAIAKQVDWYGNKLVEEDWKDIFTASLKKQKVVPGLDGDFVVCGSSTSKMGKKEFSDLIDLIQAFGAEKSVDFEQKC